MRLRKEWMLLGLMAALAAQAAEVVAPGPAEPAKEIPAAVAPRPGVPVAATAATAVSPVAPLPLEDLRVFVEVFERIRASYVEPVDDRTLFENAIRGMLSSLDPHSAYLDKKDYEELQSATTGEFDGVGLDVVLEDGVVRVVSPIDDMPAAKAGVKAGDYVIKIDGKSVQGMSLADAINLMRGKAGSTLKLTVLRKGEEPRDIEMVRARIEVSSVKTRVLEPGIVVARISQFQMHTGRDLKREIDKLKADAANPVQGLILDLRNNPGGVLDGAIAVSDIFLDSGVIVSTRGRTADSAQVFSATPGELLPGVPVVVLVSGGTASASEIVAGALQDNHRALVVGTTTFGKGSVQTVLPLTAGKGIKLTTARYYTPSGRSIQAEGIKPDIVVRPAQVTQQAGGDIFHEADLQGHLDKGAAAQNGAVAEKGDKTAKPADEKPLIERDFQMAQAVNILRASAWLQPKAATGPVSPAVPLPEKKEKVPARVKNKKGA
ncbi:MAG: S41 family peptidase [bacterium]|nr:S41 family peptidase [bacterium]